MSSASSTVISRYRPTIVVIVGAAAAYSFYLLYQTRHNTLETEDISDVDGAPLRRSNAVRRSRRRARDDGFRELFGVDDAGDQIGGADTGNSESAPHNDAATDISSHEEAPAQENGQRLRELMFAISKNRARNEGIIHRSISCDHCHRIPIVGVRYRCTNCPDFDLCEDCEAEDVHIPTHVFYKIKVPAPWGGKTPMPVWYPGKPHELPSEVPAKLKKELNEQIGCGMHRIEGFYAQFANLANTPVPEGTSQIRWGMDRNAFDQCIVPHGHSRDSAPQNLIYDRLFKFYDKNRNGLIEFEEFVIATALVHSRDRSDRTLRVFQGFDLNDDGYVSRADFLQMFRAYYVLNKDIALDHLRAYRIGERPERVIEHQMPNDFVNGGRALTSYFTEGYPSFGPNLQLHAGKVLDQDGDLINIGNGVATSVDYTGPILTRKQIVGGGWMDADAELAYEVSRLLRKASPQHPLIHKYVHISDEGYGAPNVIRFENSLYARWKSLYNHSAYLKPPNDQVEKTFGDTSSWEDKLRDEKVHKVLFTMAKRRIMVEMWSMKQNEYTTTRIHERRARSMYHLEDEDNYFVSSADSATTEGTDVADQTSSTVNNTSSALQNGISNEVSEQDSTIHASNDSSSPRLDGSNVESHIPAEPETGATANLVGGSWTSQTIYDVSQQTLNELLDPIFEPVETSDLDLVKLACNVRHKFYSRMVAWFIVQSDMPKKQINLFEPIESASEAARTKLELARKALFLHTAEQIVATEAAVKEMILPTDLAMPQDQTHAENDPDSPTQKLQELLRENPYYQQLVSALLAENTSEETVPTNDRQNGILGLLQIYIEALLHANDEESLTSEQSSSKICPANVDLEYVKRHLVDKRKTFENLIETIKESGRRDSEELLDTARREMAQIDSVLDTVTAALEPVTDEARQYFAKEPLVVVDGLIEMAKQEQARMRIQQRGGPGHIDFRQFEEIMDSGSNDDTESELPFTMWLELVMF